MKKNSLKKNSQYIYLYNYSQKYIPYTWLDKIGLKNINRENLAQFFICYLIPTLLSSLTIFISYELRFYLDKTVFYLIYLLLVVFCTWLGGIRAGIITTTIITIGAAFIFKLFNNQQYGISLELLLQNIIFIISAISSSFLISLALKTNQIVTLKNKERVYAQTFTDLHDAYIKACDEIKARDEFLSIASHELKIPLTSMLLKLHNMLNNIRNVSLANFSIPELMGALENAEKQINSLTARINDLLNLSLITTGRMELNPKKTDLVIITKQVAENFSELLKHDGYKLQIEAESPVYGYWDNNRIEEVIMNLFSNAIKYGQNKPINIKITKDEDVAKFMIKDHGIGISSKEQAFIFDRFKRTKESEELGSGLGVGLYITKQIIKAHHGKIKISSALRKGSTFTIELPIEKDKSNKTLIA